jgi:hypothetical protein
MITQTAINQTEAQARTAGPQTRRVNGAHNWHTLESSSVNRSFVVNRTPVLAGPLTGRLRYRPDVGESTGPKRLSGILVLPFLSVVVGFLLMAAILNSATPGNLGALAILAVVAAIVGFSHVLKAASELDEKEYAKHGSDRAKRQSQQTKHQGVTSTKR